MTQPRPNEQRWVVEVPVPEADPLLLGLGVRYEQNRSLRQPEAGAAVAHVSIARVVVEEERIPCSLVEQFAAACAGFGPFPFEFEKVSVFTGGVVHLLPTRTEPFCALSHVFDSMSPVQGATVEPSPGVPHLTVAYLKSIQDLDALRREIEPHLPVKGEALEAHLVLLHSKRRRLERRFPLE